MVFIGYICAVVPNPLIKTGSLTVFFLLFFLLFFTNPVLNSLRLTFRVSSLFDFFFFPQTVSLFLLVVFILFAILIIVSSQNLTPSGPFRSF